MSRSDSFRLNGGNKSGTGSYGRWPNSFDCFVLNTWFISLISDWAEPLNQVCLVYMYTHSPPQLLSTRHSQEPFQQWDHSAVCCLTLGKGGEGDKRSWGGNFKTKDCLFNRFDNSSKVMILSLWTTALCTLLWDSLILFILIPLPPSPEPGRWSVFHSVCWTALNTNHPSPGKTSRNLSWNKAQT